MTFSDIAASPMHNPSTIQFLKNSEIDKPRWDACVKESDNALIYANTFYLDNIAPGWNALTGEDYNWVLPVICKRKYGISYLYQPPFTQQLGVFARPNIKVPFDQILSYLQQHYKFWEVNWNYATPLFSSKLPLQVSAATNFILDLSAGYESIAAKYYSDLFKNLKRNKRFKTIYRTTNDFQKCIGLYRQHYGKRMPHVKESDYRNFSAICTYASQNNMLVCWEALDEQGSLMAAALLLVDGKRLYNLMNTTTTAGRATGANHFLLDAVIREFSSRQLVLDFEGSDLPGVKAFYDNFGAVNQPYFSIKYNNLPAIVRLFKK